jgi:type I restriction enzyme S subunit
MPFVALENLESRTGDLLPDTELPLVVPNPTGTTSFRPGDVLFGKLRPYLAKSWRADRRGSCSTELIVMRPRPSVDDRWLAYLAQSDLLVEWAIATSEGVKMPRTSWEKIRLLQVYAPPKPVQRAIADYLDAETARIDALVVTRRRMLQLLDERLDALITRTLDRPDWQLIPLKWTTRVTVGIVNKPAELYVDVGLPCLRGVNIQPGTVSDSDLVHISAEGNAANAKSILREGDVVVVRTGNAGAAAVVPPWAVGGNCVDLLIVRRADTIDPRFLEIVLNSAVVRRQIAEQSVGALQAHFNTESLAVLRVPVPSTDEQAEVLADLDAARAEARGMRDVVARQVGLLAERRRAVITAAVAGDLAIPGVVA